MSVLDAAQAQEASNPDAAIATYRALLNDAKLDDTVKESALIRAACVLAAQGKHDAVSQLLVDVRPFFGTISKTRTALIVRNVMDAVSKLPNTTELLIRLCREGIEWCKAEKYAVLRQKLETKLAGLLEHAGQYQAALDIVKPLLREVKRLDDKELLVEIHLVESACYHAQHNVSKSKATLTAARTAANQIYVLPSVQGRIDIMAGVLHSEERDFKTAYSYFLEAFDNYNALDSPMAMRALVYMLLTKIMLGSPQDVHQIVSGKVALKFAAARPVIAMRAVADAYKARSLAAFEAASTTYKDVLSSDRLVAAQLEELYDTMLEQNLLRLLEPFSCVEITHVAKLIALPQPTVEKKLAQLILDKKLNGILDQGNGCLLIFESEDRDKTYNYTLDTLKELGNVLDSLSTKTGLLRA
jgi:26S proteasome regulatory subunit N6